MDALDALFEHGVANPIGLACDLGPFRHVFPFLLRGTRLASARPGQGFAGAEHAAPRKRVVDDRDAKRTSDTGISLGPPTAARYSRIDARFDGLDHLEGGGDSFAEPLHIPVEVRERSAGTTAPRRSRQAGAPREHLDRQLATSSAIR